MARPALILFGHGSRDPRWAEPFERLRAIVAARRPEADVELAFLELMTPAVADAINARVAAGATRITIVPVFFGQGGHVRRDLPALVEQARQTHPQVRIDVASAVGESDDVLSAIGDYCLHSLDATPDA